MKSQEIFDVRDLVCIVTGAASGLGYAMAEVLCANGARVYLLDRTADVLDAAVDRCAAQTACRPGAIAGDVADAAFIEHAFDQVEAECGHVDVVFANAGIGAGPGFASYDEHGERDATKAIENIPEDGWRKVLDVNLNGAFNTVRSAVRRMKPHRRGSIILTTSTAALRVAPAVGTAYATSKAAAAQFARSVAIEVARYGIRVNCIAPGPFVTQIGGGKMMSSEVQKAYAKRIPLGRVADPSEIRGVALFLASAAASFVTGAQFVIDGGSSVGIAPD